MADKVTATTELNIVLSNTAGTATRVLKVSNPRPMSELTFAQIKQALLPAFGSSNSSTSSDTAVIDLPFFYDDGNQGGYSEPMTRVDYAEWVNIVKTTRRYDETQNSNSD